MQLDFRCDTLKNGMRVVTARMPHVESVAMGVLVGVGGRYETKAQSGMCHFIEHLLFKGTKQRSARDISQAIEGKGGYFNAFTQEESTCYYARVTRDYHWDVFDVLADMYLHPRFDPSDIDRERNVIIEEIMMYRDQPHHVVQEMLAELLWANHPLGRPIIGTVDNILNVTRSEIASYKKNRYVPGNTLVLFAGHVDHDDCVQKVKGMMGRITPKAVSNRASITSKTAQKSFWILHKDIEQVHLAMGFRHFGRTDKRKYALKLLSIILGENMSSRLFQVVREKHGMAYSISSHVELFDDTGVLSIQAGVDRERILKAYRLIMKELDRIKTKRVSVDELQRAKDYAVGQLRIGLESTTNQMMWAGDNILHYGCFKQPDEVVENLRRVTREEIRDVAECIFIQKRLSAAVVAPGVDGALKREMERVVLR